MNGCEKRGLIGVQNENARRPEERLIFLTEKQNLRSLTFFTFGNVASPAKIRESLSGLITILGVGECTLDLFEIKSLKKKRIYEENYCLWRIKRKF